ncbi:MAG: putative pre6S rRNA nuclease [Patescibacteria group bacterium]|nr:putative pre6S rRNA nuclease [Patescibacteria group bacterium]
MKYLGIDYGSKKVGFAQSDESGSFAFPLMIAANDDSLTTDTLEIIRAMDISFVVIGESLDQNGKPNKIAKEAKKFGDIVKEKSGKDVLYEKEWFTTSEARKQPGARNEVDDAAAALILQRYLDKINPKKFSEEEGEDDSD